MFYKDWEVKEGILQVYRSCSVPRVEESNDVPNTLHPDNWPPTAFLLGDQEQVGLKPWGVWVGHLDSRLLQKGLDLL